jgi:hypothetical protein
MLNEDRPKNLNQLLMDEDWMKKFCTYKQLRSILHQMKHHTSLQPVKLIIEPDTDQNFITINYSTGEKFTF